MKKNKKLISLVCAIAMIFTMLSGLAITANAAGEGFTVSEPVLADDGKTATFDVGFTGFDSGLKSGKFSITFPAAVTSATNADNKSVVDTAKFNATALPKIQYSFVAAEGATGSGTITTITVEFADVVSKDIKFTIDDDSNLYNSANTKYVVGADTNPLTATEATVHNPAAPTAKPTTDQTRPTPVALPTANPDATAAPTIAPAVKPAEGERGFTISDPTVSTDGKEISFDIGFTGFIDGLKSGKFSLVLPTDASNIASATNTDNKSVVDTAKFNATALPKIQYSFVAAEGATGSGTITTVTVKLNEKLPADTQIAIDNDSNLYNSTNTKYVVGADTNGMVATNAIIKAVASGDEPTPAPVLKEVALTDAISITPDEVNAKDTPEAGVSDYYIIPNITVNGEEADYGDDYVATIKKTDGSTKELTKAEYQNLMSGNFSAVPDLCTEAGITKMGDVISKLGLKIYNKDAVVNPKLVYVTTDDDGNPINEIQNDDDDPITVEPTVNPTYKKPTLSVKASKTSTTVGSGDTITVTATYDFKDYANNATVAISAVDDTLDLATSSGFKIEYEQAEEDLLDLVTKIEDDVTLIDNIAEKGTIKITYKPGSVGTAKFTFAITGQNEAGTVLDKPVTGTASTKINKASTSGSGSGSSSKDSDNKSSGGGAIATGLVDSGSGYIPSLGFDDLGDVEWAQNAINTLAAKKIVSGVGDNKFDPNAALTRAAYAQMLVNAIGHSQDSADVEFDDVPTDAWFYHNVAVAAQLGIVAGFGDGTFRPYDLITREQMALMTQKAAVVMGKSLVGADAGTFTDDADIADWSRDAVYQLSNAGIINGMGDGSFAPQANATRAQAAVIIYQAFVK